VSFQNGLAYFLFQKAIRVEKELQFQKLARLEVTARGSKRHQVCFCIISFFSRTIPGGSSVEKIYLSKNSFRPKKIQFVPTLVEFQKVETLKNC
jgi:hypothetical protein